MVMPYRWLGYETAPLVEAEGWTAGVARSAPEGLQNLDDNWEKRTENMDLVTARTESWGGPPPATAVQRQSREGAESHFQNSLVDV